MLEIGTKAPDFELPDQNGEMHKLSDYAGKKVSNGVQGVQTRLKRKDRFESK